MESTLRHVARIMLTQVAVPDTELEQEARRQPFNVDLMKVLFGLQSPSMAPLESLTPESLDQAPERSPIDWFDTTLNDSQKRAVEFTLRANEVACIHGPPGVSIPLDGRLEYALIAC
jgi:DNA polymerase alpha-associated DNA helicase A